MPEICSTPNPANYKRKHGSMKQKMVGQFSRLSNLSPFEMLFGKRHFVQQSMNLKIGFKFVQYITIAVIQ